MTTNNVFNLTWTSNNINFVAKSLNDGEDFEIEAIHSQTKLCWASCTINSNTAKSITEGTFNKPLDSLKKVIDDAINSRKGVNYTLHHKVKLIIRRQFHF